MITIIELETKRLKLKNINHEDDDFMYSEFSNDLINEFLYDAEPISSIEEAKEWIDFYLKDSTLTRNRWIIILKKIIKKLVHVVFIV